MTNDVDIVVFLQRADAPRLHAAFPEDEFYCPPRGHFNLIHHASGFKADIYPVSDDLHRWGLSCSRVAMLDEDRIVLAPPEYVIVRKLQFFREGGSTKHLRDISRMLASLGEDWSADQLREFVCEYHLESEWKQVVDFDRDD